MDLPLEGSGAGGLGSFGYGQLVIDPFSLRIRVLCPFILIWF